MEQVDGARGCACVRAMGFGRGVQVQREEWRDGLFDSGNSIASVIANEFAEAKDLHMSALLALGLILFFIAFVVLVIARALIRKVEKS